ncbi:MAG: hypothetical protein FJ398_12125 [Verrucomicrobia bacterium]|nr:hypothetical protein [Verrucomicrobiota bacterium]
MNSVRTRSTASLETSFRSLSKVRDGVESVPTRFMGSFHDLRAVCMALKPVAGRTVLLRRRSDRRPAERQRSPARLMAPRLSFGL